MAIKAIIFDVGGVLLKTQDRSFRNSLEEKYDLEPGGSEHLVFSSKAAQSAQRGEITIHALWRTVANALGLDELEIREFKKQFWAGDQLDQTLIELIGKLKNHYKTAIISNYTDELHNDLHNRFQISHLFDYIVVSAIEGVMKPDNRIFEITLKRLGIEPEESVFIDDSRVNIDASLALGIKSIHYTPETNLVTELNNLGIIYD